MCLYKRMRTNVRVYIIQYANNVFMISTNQACVCVRQYTHLQQYRTHPIVHIFCRADPQGSYTINGMQAQPKEYLVLTNANQCACVQQYTHPSNLFITCTNQRSACVSAHIHSSIHILAQQTGRAHVSPTFCKPMLWLCIIQRYTHLSNTCKTCTIPPRHVKSSMHI